MKKNIIIIMAAVMLAGLAAACGSGRQTQKAAEAARVTPVRMGGESAYLPKAIIYKTNGDYNDNVPVNLNAEGTMLASYPAPTDITQRSTPVVLSDGWLLDRRGVGVNTVFTRYTYSEYMKLPQVPEDLMQSIIPGSKVTELVQLPIGHSEAAANPSLCEPYIKDGFKDCKVLLK